MKRRIRNVPDPYRGTRENNNNNNNRNHQNRQNANHNRNRVVEDQRQPRRQIDSPFIDWVKTYFGPDLDNVFFASYEFTHFVSSNKIGLTTAFGVAYVFVGSIIFGLGLEDNIFRYLIILTGGSEFLVLLLLLLGYIVSLFVAPYIGLILCILYGPFIYLMWLVIGAIVVLQGSYTDTNLLAAVPHLWMISYILAVATRALLDD